MKYILILLLVIGLTSCEKETTEVSGKFQLPKGLEDCTIYRLESEGGTTIYVTRCPHSDTTTQWRVQSGKISHKYSNSVVEM